MVHWERFEIDGADDLPDWYTGDDHEDRYYYQASFGNLTLSVGACYYMDMFAGWGWHIERDGKPVVEYTFRSNQDAFDTSRQAKASVLLYARQFFPEDRGIRRVLTKIKLDL